jgi:hypothetical protein
MNPAVVKLLLLVERMCMNPRLLRPKMECDDDFKRGGLIVERILVK